MTIHILLSGMTVMLCLSCAYGTSNASPYTAVTYIAPTVPTQQHWSATIDNGGGLAYVSAASAIDQLSTNEVWATHLVSGGHPASVLYERQLPSSVSALGLEYGWTYSAQMRLPASNAYFADGAPALLFQTATKAYSLRFDATADLNAILIAETNLSPYFPASPQGITYISNVSYSNYHWYSMTYCPTLGVVQVAIDGSVVVSNYSGFALTGSDRIVWGVAGDAADAQTFWRQVDLEVNLPRPRLVALSSPSNQANAVRIGWCGATNVSYRVEVSERRLCTQAWEMLTAPIRGRNGFNEALLTNQSQQSAFYRLSTLPQD